MARPYLGARGHRQRRDRHLAAPHVNLPGLFRAVPLGPPAALIAVEAGRLVTSKLCKWEGNMVRNWAAAAALAFLGMASSVPAAAFDRGHVETFAVLPEGLTGPEGLTVGPDGNVYVTTFGFNAQGEVPGLSQLLVFRPDGKLVRNVAIEKSSPHTLGLGFNPVSGDLIVLDFGAGTALKVNPLSGKSSVFMTVTGASGL